MPTTLRRANQYAKKARIPGSVVIDYHPHERQSLAHQSSARYKLFGGAMGGGKSWWLCAEAIRLSVDYPGNRGYLCRHEFAQFRRSTLLTLDRLLPVGLVRRHYKDERVIIFRNDSEIYYGGLGLEDDIQKIKSTEFGWFGIDEASETNEEYFNMLDSRLRHTLPNGQHPPYFALCCSNPEPGWLKERFVDQRLPDHDFIKSLPSDNVNLPDGYYATLRKNFPEEWVKRYLEGSWDVFEGQIYTEFSREKHVFGDEVEIDETWEHGRVIDHGFRNPTCCLWWCIDYDGVIWIYDEYYQRGRTIEENAKVIEAMRPGMTGLTLADPSMFSATMQKHGKPWSPADEYRDNGIAVIRPYGAEGKVTEVNGINMVKQRLIAGTLKIHEKCMNTLKEIAKYKWRDYSIADKRTRNAPEEPVDKDNHACLPGATLISTPDGPKRLDMIRFGDEIHTHLGVGRAQSDSVWTGAKELFSLTVNDTRLYCSSGHKFMTKEGILPIERMKGVSIWQKRRGSLTGNGTISIPKDTIPLRVRIRHAIRTAASSIRRCGSIITGKSLQEWSFTTSTAIRPTTLSTTYALSTPCGTWSNATSPISNLPAKPQSDGTHLQRGYSGIVGIPEKSGGISRQSAITASCAARSSNPASNQALYSVAARTKRIIDSGLVWMISMLPVRSVLRLSELIAIARRKRAPRNALESSPAAVEKTSRKESVYNFSSSDGTFVLYDSGLVSVQCDCIRYLSMWRPANSAPPPKPIDRNSLHYAILKHKKMLGYEGTIGWDGMHL